MTVNELLIHPCYQLLLGGGFIQLHFVCNSCLKYWTESTDSVLEEKTALNLCASHSPNLALQMKGKEQDRNRATNKLA